MAAKVSYSIATPALSGVHAPTAEKPKAWSREVISFHAYETNAACGGIPRHRLSVVSFVATTTKAKTQVRTARLWLGSLDNYTPSIPHEEQGLRVPRVVAAVASKVWDVITVHVVRDRVVPSKEGSRRVGVAQAYPVFLNGNDIMARAARRKADLGPQMKAKRDDSAPAQRLAVLPHA